MADEIVSITGISGFLGYGAALEALQAGYRVRGIIRKASQADKLKSTLPAEFSSKVDFVIVPDLAAKGAFDKVLKGSDYVIHIASPIGVETTDFEKDYFRPSVDITLSLLRASAASGTVKRVVVCSSVSAYIPTLEYASGKLSKEFIESDDDFIHYTGKEQFPHHLFAYAASKSLALDATDNFVKTEAPPFDVVIVVPSFVFGPGKLKESAEEFARGSNAILLGHLLGKPTGPLLTISVHIDDVSRAHVAALKPSVAPGKYLLDSEKTDWAIARQVVKTHFPESLGKVFPEEVPTQTITLHLEGSKAEKAFGFRFKSFETQVKDTVKYYLGLISN